MLAHSKAPSQHTLRSLLRNSLQCSSVFRFTRKTFVNTDYIIMMYYERYNIADLDMRGRSCSFFRKLNRYTFCFAHEFAKQKSVFAYIYNLFIIICLLSI